MEDSSVVCAGGLDFEDYVLCKDQKSVVLSKGLNSEDAYEENVADMNCVLELECNANEPKHRLQIDEIDRQARDDELSQQLERLWRTDFENCEVETRVCASLEDKRALEIIKTTLKMVMDTFRLPCLGDMSHHFYLTTGWLQSKEVCF